MSRLHLAIYSAEARLSDSKDQTDFAEKKSRIKGMREAIDIFETLVEEVRMGVHEDNDKENDE